MLSLPDMSPSWSLPDTIASLLSAERDISGIDVRGQRVLVRCDLNVPLRGGGGAEQCVADRARVDAALPALRALAAAGARVVVLSHLGRPQPGKEPEEEMRRRDSLRPVSALLAAELGPAVFAGFAEDTVGPSAAALAGSLRDGQVCLLENTRFSRLDEEDDAGFASQLAQFCDLYVLDGFGVSHRAQASVSGVARCLPLHRRFPGLLVRREIMFLGEALDQPKRPFGVVLGGMKVKDKMGVLWALIRKADVVIIGGRMAFTFLAARGVAVGATQVETERLQDARAMQAAADAAGVRLLLPADVLCSSSLQAPLDTRVVRLAADCCSDAAPCVPTDAFGVDIGPETASQFEEAIAGCATLLWNGPMGKFEVPAFAEGTRRVMHALARAHDERGAVVVAAGGDSVAALNETALAGSFTHVSTGGGASLQLLEGCSMPGLQALVQ